jgi:hypothetical protein
LPILIVGLLRLRGGLSLVNIMATTHERHFRVVGGGRLGDRLIIPQMEKSGYPGFLDE